MSKEITIVSGTGNSLVSDDTTKIQIIEDELDEIKVNLSKVDKVVLQSIEDLSRIAHQSQEDASYEVLAKLVSASAKIAKERNAVAMAKASLYNTKKVPDAPVSEPNQPVNNNTIIMTSEEMLERVLDKQ